ncbi:MAG: hypothetical protein ACFCUQ_04330 [Kiloniellales bacterium]
MIASRHLIALLAVAVPLLLGGPAGAQQQPSGTVQLEATAVSLGIGMQQGQGTLTLNDGRQFRFTVKGFKLGDLGISQLKASGVVYNLGDIDWFPGTYTSGEVGATIGAGLSTLLMQNQQGVTISLNTTQEGLRFTLAAEALEIAWE